MKKLLFTAALMFTASIAFAGVRVEQYIEAGDCTPDTTAPEFSSATIDGTALAITFDEAVYQSYAWANSTIDVDMSVTGDGNAVTYTSGNGTATHNFTVATAATSLDTVDVDFDGTPEALEDTARNDMLAFTNASVTNNTSGGVGPVESFNRGVWQGIGLDRGAWQGE